MKKLNVMLEDELLIPVSDPVPRGLQKQFPISKNLNRKKENMITNRMYLQIACNIIAFTIGILTLASPALAIPFTYDITYDPSTGISTLFNSAGSSAELEFWTMTGSMEYTPLFLTPGGSVTIDAAGDVSGTGWSMDAVLVHNKHVFQPVTITWDASFKGSINYWLTPPTGYVHVNIPGGSAGGPINLPVGAHFNISITGGTGSEMHILGDAQMTPITSFIDAYFQGPDWPGDPSQANIELLSGGLKSADDTDSATSIFTPNVGTDCYPAPDGTATWFLCAIVFSGLAGLKRCLG